MAITKSNGSVADPATLAGNVAETAPAPVSGSLASLAKHASETPKIGEGRKDYKTRDFDAEARGKVACVAFNAALSSPGIAGLQFSTFEEYIALVRKAADASVAYTWEHQK